MKYFQLHIPSKKTFEETISEEEVRVLADYLNITGSIDILLLKLINRWNFLGDNIWKYWI